MVDGVTTGDVVGELGLLSDHPRNADVVATTALEVLSLDRTGLQRALDVVPGMGWTLLTTVAERLHRAESPADHGLRSRGAHGPEYGLDAIRAICRLGDASASEVDGTTPTRIEGRAR